MKLKSGLDTFDLHHPVRRLLGSVLRALVVYSTADRVCDWYCLRQVVAASCCVTVVQRVRREESRSLGRHARPQSASEDDTAPVDWGIGQETRGNASCYQSGNEYQPLRFVIIKWRWWMWMIAAFLPADSQPKSIGLVWGLAATWRWVCIHHMHPVNSRNGATPWWQHHKYRRGIRD